MNRLFLAPGNMYVLPEKKFAISNYRFGVCTYSGSRGEIEIFGRET